jgi:hypothetical protein
MVESSDQSTSFGQIGEDSPELESTYSVPGVFVNRFYLAGLGTNVRITFGEQRIQGGKVDMRTSVVMTVADVIQLKEIIDLMIQSIQYTDSSQMNTSSADPG